MEQAQTVTLKVKVPQRYAAKFLAGMTGDDGDILLAAERAMREHVDTDPTGDAIEVDRTYPDEAAEEDGGLRALAALEGHELKVYGPHA
jgi:hypothetical protein